MKIFHADLTANSLRSEFNLDRGACGAVVVLCGGGYKRETEDTTFKLIVESKFTMPWQKKEQRQKTSNSHIFEC